MNLLIGLDPGLDGSIAVYDFKSKTLEHLWDIPTRTNPKNGKRNLDLIHFAQIINGLKDKIRQAVVEQNESRPNQGLSSTYKFGFESGLVSGILIGAQIPTYFVKPQIWKSVLGLSSDKDLSRALAIKKFPNQADLFKRKKDDGRAEAALLAVFGERLIK